jgi:hypothetical protein
MRKISHFICIKSYHANLDWYFKIGDICKSEECFKLTKYWKPVYK